MCALNQGFLITICICSISPPWQRRGTSFTLQDRSAQPTQDWNGLPFLPDLFCVCVFCVYLAMFNTTFHNLIYLHLLPHYHQPEISPAVFYIHLFFKFTSQCTTSVLQALCIITKQFFPSHLHTANHLVNVGLLYTLKQLCY